MAETTPTDDPQKKKRRKKRAPKRQTPPQALTPDQPPTTGEQTGNRLRGTTPAPTPNLSRTPPAQGGQRAATPQQAPAANIARRQPAPQAPAQNRSAPTPDPGGAPGGSTPTLTPDLNSRIRTAQENLARRTREADIEQYGEALTGEERRKRREQMIAGQELQQGTPEDVMAGRVTGRDLNERTVRHLAPQVQAMKAEQRQQALADMRRRRQEQAMQEQRQDRMDDLRRAAMRGNPAALELFRGNQQEDLARQQMQAQQAQAQTELEAQRRAQQAEQGFNMNLARFQTGVESEAARRQREHEEAMLRLQRELTPEQGVTLGPGERHFQQGRMLEGTPLPVDPLVLGTGDMAFDREGQPLATGREPTPDRESFEFHALPEYQTDEYGSVQSGVNPRVFDPNTGRSFDPTTITPTPEAPPAQGTTSQTPDTPTTPGDSASQVTSAEEYEALPPGSVYIDPQGNRRRKPNG